MDIFNNIYFINEALFDKFKKKSNNQKQKYTKEEIDFFENRAEEIFDENFNKWKSLIITSLRKNNKLVKAVDFDNAPFFTYYDNENAVVAEIAFLDLYKIYPNLRSSYSPELINPIYNELKECIELLNKYNINNNLDFIKFKINEDGDWDDPIRIDTITHVSGLKDDKLKESSIFESIKFI